MKQHSTKSPAIFKFIAVAIITLFIGVKTANACHGVALVGLVTNNTGSSMTLDGSSDAATCGCGPYYIQVEVTCQPTFQGNPYAYTDPLWNTAGQPYYHSILNVPGYSAPNWTENCAVEPYNQLVVPFADLCPGTLYHWRYRENPETGTPSAWFPLPDFTTPGTPPASILVATANQYEGCPGDLIQLNASVSGGCPGATYAFQWSPATGLSNPNIQNPVCTLSTNITYTVTTSGGCFTITSADDTVGLTIGPAPTAGIPSAFPSGICSGQSSWVVLSGQSPGAIQWEVSTNGVTWFNIPGANDDSLNTGPLSSSLYFHAIVTGTGWPSGTGCGTATSPPVQVIVNQSPVADAGTNTSVCSGGCTNLTGTGGVTYTWQPGNLSGSTVNVCPGGATTYTLYITDANGCSDSDMVTVNISTPAVTASPSVSICNGNSTVLVASGPSGQTYAWLPSGTLTGANTANPTATPTTTTTYTVTATNSFGCTAVDSVVVQVTSAPPVVASNDTSLCNGGSATLAATGTATTYTWNPGNMSGQTVTVSPIATTTYVVTANTNNCISYDTVIVTVAPPFTVYAGPDFDVCAGTQVTLNVGVSGGTYTWLPAASIVGSNNTQSVVANPSGTTTYTVNVTDANGCISSDQITVTVNALPVVNASSPFTVLCAGQSANINATGASNYLWTPNVGVANPTQASTTATPPNTTTYMVTGTDINGCIDTDTITIFVNPNPSVFLASVPTECGDTSGQIQFGASSAGTPPFTYQIGSTPYTLPITGLAAGNYNVTYTDANGCTNMTGVTVFMQNTASITASADPMFGVHPLTVNFDVNGTPGVNTYAWTFGDQNTGVGTNPTNTYQDTGYYMVIVTGYNDDPNCAVFDTLWISVIEQASIMLPNVFTPNNDATNDWFSATVSGVQEIKVQMYNRWGNLVYEGTQSGISSAPQDVALWDGKANSGKVADDGVYYYIVTALGYDQAVYPMSGFVHLLTEGK